MLPGCTPQPLSEHTHNRDWNAYSGMIHEFRAMGSCAPTPGSTMEQYVYGVVLLASLLHACWNAMASTDKGIDPFAKAEIFYITPAAAAIFLIGHWSISHIRFWTEPAYEYLAVSAVVQSCYTI